MKKILKCLVLALVIPCMLLLGACDVKLQGKWQLNGFAITIGGEETSVSLEEVKNFDTTNFKPSLNNTGKDYVLYLLAVANFDDYTFVVEFKDDGSAVLSTNIGSENQTLNATYTVSGEKVALISSDIEDNKELQNYNVSYKSGKLTITSPEISEAGMTVAITFKKI